MKSGLIAFSLLSAFLVTSAFADDPETVVKEAITALTAKQSSAEPIPSNVFHDAKAVGIVKVTQGGLVIGGSGGVGVLLAHEGRQWSAPFFFHLGSHSFGLQAGAGVKDYILIVNNNDDIKLFANDEKKDFQALGHYIVSPGSGSIVADGPDRPQSLVIYASAQGAYAGATLGDTLIGNSPEINTAVYQTADDQVILSNKVTNPSYAEPLQKLLRQYSVFDPKEVTDPNSVKHLEK